MVTLSIYPPLARFWHHITNQSARRTNRRTQERGKTSGRQLAHLAERRLVRLSCCYKLGGELSPPPPPLDPLLELPQFRLPPRVVPPRFSFSLAHASNAILESVQLCDDPGTRLTHAFLLFPLGFGFGYADAPL